MKRIVITGGTFSGKTTLINHFRSLGYTVVAESAMQIITGLNQLIGVEAQKYWRKKNPVLFQEFVWRKMAILEGEIINEAGIVFYDRGVFDGFAYIDQNKKTEFENLFNEIFHDHSGYDLAFVLDTIPEFDNRAETGRTSTYESSKSVKEKLNAIYLANKIQTYSIPVSPTKKRAELMISKIQLS